MRCMSGEPPWTRPVTDRELPATPLHADERARAERFHFQSDREHFIVARGALRAILGFYLKRAPECLSFRYSSHGKPALALESGEDPIHFNMSHSHGVALYAVTCGREVGIDLEFIRSDLEVEQIAERFFSRQEICDTPGAPGGLAQIRILSLLDPQGSLHQGQR